MIEKGLMLDKADFAENGYEMDKNQFSRIPGKAASASSWGKQNVDIVMLDDDSDENTKNEAEIVPLEEEATSFDAGMEEESDTEPLEEGTRDDEPNWLESNLVGWL
jgi:hypothetical protein